MHSKLLYHCVFRKHICGTSICSISPRVPNEDNIKVEFRTDHQERKTVVKNWFQTQNESDSIAIIVFSKKSGLVSSTATRQNHSILETIEVDTKQIFTNEPLDDYRTLLFSGCEFDHVLIIFECDTSIHDISDSGSTQGQTFGQNLLIATTRARKTLTILVANEEQKGQLDIFREDDHQLIVAQVIGNEEKEKAILKEKLKGNYENETLKDVLRIVTHREDIETFKEVVGIIWRKGGTNKKNDTVNAFIDAVLPGCIGRQKSMQFLKKLGKLIAHYNFRETINSCPHKEAKKKLTRWFVSAYYRARIETLDWRMELGPTNLSAEEKVSLFKEILVAALKEGSELVVKHAFEKGSEFCGVDETEIGKIIDGLQIEIDSVQYHSPLSVITRTNKDVDLVEYLLRKIHQFENNESKIVEIIKEAMKWSVQYPSFRMLRVLIAEEQHFAILREILQEASAEWVRRFIETVNRITESAENANWSDDNKELLKFIIEMKNTVTSKIGNRGL